MAKDQTQLRLGREPLCHRSNPQPSSEAVLESLQSEVGAVGLSYFQNDKASEARQGCCCGQARVGGVGMWASQGLVHHVNADPLLVHQLEGVRGRA